MKLLQDRRELVILRAEKGRAVGVADDRVLLQRGLYRNLNNAMYSKIFMSSGKKENAMQSYRFEFEQNQEIMKNMLDKIS